MQVRVYGLVLLLCLVPSGVQAGPEDGGGDVNEIPDDTASRWRVLPGSGPGTYSLNEGGFVHAEFHVLALSLRADMPPPRTDNMIDPSLVEAPWGLVALPFPEGVALKWNTPLLGDPDGYRVYRAVDDGPPEAVGDALDTLFIDTGAWQTNATILTYTVRALYTQEGAQIESAPSNMAVVAGPFEDCYLIWLRPFGEDGLVGFTYNPAYLDCVTEAMSAHGD